MSNPIPPPSQTAAATRRPPNRPRRCLRCYPERSSILTSKRLAISFILLDPGPHLLDGKRPRRGQFLAFAAQTLRQPEQKLSFLIRPKPLRGVLDFQ